ncbi:uncharacterized protein LOC142977263 [Anticarsia gemmatalis]|uniref:uncharacterized protein LOC142977263 n=1 Tax=Anticarsia gemmatalis TaxID=129554 RepID=UPI003F75D935
MGIKVWCSIALIFLTATKGELYDNVAQSFYEKPESSSPAPGHSQAASNHLVRMKELVLYLTPDQVQALQQAGAVVKPFPEFENALLQQKYQQNIQAQTERPYESVTTSQDLKQETELDDFYKVVNIQQINEDLSIQTPPPEQSTEKTRPKYKYTQKSRQQEYSTSYVQKKLNRGKVQSTEYVRYLPSFESEDLKMEPFRAQPLPGYRFEGVQYSFEPQVQYQTEAPAEIKIPDDVPPALDVPTLSIPSTEAQHTIQPIIQNESSMEDKGPVTFGEREPAKIYESGEVQTPIEIQTSSEFKPVQPQVLVGQPEVVPKLSEPAPTPAAVQRQYSSLLAPLLRHDKITESITQQKEDLVNKERAIQTKLKQIKDSGDSDEEKIAIELDKLKNNLGKQNALAEKLALETISKKPQNIVKEDNIFNRRRPVEILKHAPVAPKILLHVPKSSEVRVPQPYPLPLQVRPIPVPVLQPETINIDKPGTRNIFVKVDNPYLLSKNAPLEIRHELESKYPIVQPDKLTVIRHLWEH